jgi:hypothetical protein
MFASVLIPTAFFMFLLMRVPQAPRWLAAKGRYDEALQVLSKINGAGEAGKELYPTRIRARAVSITTTFLWIAGFTGPFAFPIIEATSKKILGTSAGVFWSYAVVCVFSFFWTLKFPPETKGRTLEEIGASWQRGHDSMSRE